MLDFMTPALQPPGWLTAPRQRGKTGFKPVSFTRPVIDDRSLLTGEQLFFTRPLLC
jgi:hypothetical protein